MHEDAGYRYVGDGRMGKLTNQELSHIQLGFLVRGEEMEKAREDAKRRSGRSRRKYSRPDKTLDQAMADYEQKIQSNG